MQKIPFLQLCYFLCLEIAITIFCNVIYFFKFEIKHFWRLIERMLQTAVVYVAYNSNTLPSYLTEQELVHHGWKCFLFCKIPLKSFWGKLNIIAKISQKMILPNNCCISLCHTPCLSRDWGIQTQNISSQAAYLRQSMPVWKEKSDFSLFFTICADKHPFSAVVEDFMNIAYMLYQIWSCWLRTMTDVIMEFATDDESFLAAVDHKNHQIKQIAWTPVNLCLLCLRKKGRPG